MSEDNQVNYGPLTDFIGVWQGDKGTDIAPEPDGEENNPYYETITYTASGTATNAEEQTYAVVHYHQVVRRKSNDEVFHNQTGYWLWDAATDTIVHSFTIPRGMAVLATGKRTGNRIDMYAPQEGIVQTDFMLNKAKTTSFKQYFEFENGKMKYWQLTMLEIYGRTFEHTDENELTKVG